LAKSLILAGAILAAAGISAFLGLRHLQGVGGPQRELADLSEKN
jgi:hypothetical protein